MNLGKLVFAQITQHLPLTTFRRCVMHYGGEHKVKTFSCLERYGIRPADRDGPTQLDSFFGLLSGTLRVKPPVFLAAK